MDYCDAYWQQLADEESGKTIESSERIQSNYSQMARVELGSRGQESLQWAIDRLSHSDYFARETAAGLVDTLAKKQLLGPHRKTAIRALSELATRKWEEDTKEIQANDVAVSALATIGDRECIPAIRTILYSPYWTNDDLSWSAAEALSQIVGESFMETDSPVDAARNWLKKNQDD